MKLVENKLRVVHIPQVPMKGFRVLVENEREAFLIQETLANQHLWLEKNNVIPDYSNVIFVEMFDNGKWQDYYNDKDELDWEQFCEKYSDYVNGKKLC